MKNTIKLLFVGLFLFGITTIRAQISTATGGAANVLPNVPTTNTNVGIGTTNPLGKLDVAGGLPDGQVFASADEANQKSLVFNFGSIVNSSAGARMVKFYDWPKSNLSAKARAFFAIEDRADMGRYRFIAETDGSTEMWVSNKRQEVLFRVREDGSDNVFMDLPKPNSRIVIAGYGDYLPEHKFVVRGSAKIEGNIITDSNIGIGTITPSEKLDVDGNIKASGTATFASTVAAIRLISNVSTGTSPLTVASTTVVSNLNADLLDGLHASSFQPSSANLTAINNIVYTGANVAAVKTASGWVSKDASIFDTPYAGNNTFPVKLASGWGYANVSNFIQTSGNNNISGIITAPTAALGTNTAQLATTAFVLANAAPKIGGSSASSEYLKYNDGPRNLTDRLPNTFTRAVHYDFVTAGTTASSGNYAGVMTYNNWDGTTSGTGDSSYQLAYINESGINGAGIPGLKLRKGIDATWGNWYSIITNNATTTTANYVPMFSGTNGIVNSTIYDNGNVGIGSTNPDQKLTVKGKIHAEEIIVDLAVPADYVFQKYYTGKSELKPDYIMPTLDEIESFTKENHHLPNVPSAKEVQQNGMSLGTISNVLLQKVEELTLYAIDQQKKLEEQNKTIEMQSKILESLAERLNSFEKK